MPGLVGSLNHSLERSLRVLPLLAASCPLDWGFFIGFSRRGPFEGSDFYSVYTQRKSARMTNRLRDWTLVEEAWLRYHFVFLAASRGEGTGKAPHGRVEPSRCPI